MDYAVKHAQLETNTDPCTRPISVVTVMSATAPWITNIVSCLLAIRNVNITWFQLRIAPTPNSAFRTIMAYDCPSGCPRIQYFSTPSINYNGQALRNAVTNNAQQIRKNLSFFANYRQSVAVVAPQSAPTPAPVVVAVPQPAPTPSPIAVVPTGPPTQPTIVANCI
jgi:hypothetical protein